MSRSGSRTVRFAGRMRTTNNQLPSLDKNQRQTDLVLAGLRRLSTVTIILGYRYYEPRDDRWGRAMAIISSYRDRALVLHRQLLGFVRGKAAMLSGGCL